MFEEVSSFPPFPFWRDPAEKSSFDGFVCVRMLSNKARVTFYTFTPTCEPRLFLHLGAFCETSIICCLLTDDVNGDEKVNI